MEVMQDQNALPPRIQNYESYRKFLSDVYNYKRRQRSGFSYRRFSQILQLKSTNYIQLIITGQRNLSNELAEKIAALLRLTQEEQAYFVSLVRCENADTEESRKQTSRERYRALKPLITSSMAARQGEVIEKWYHLAVCELVRLKDFEPTGEYVSQKLNGTITPEQGEQSLNLLLSTGFLKINSQGVWEASNPVMDTGTGVFSQDKIESAHSENLKIWSRLVLDSDPTLRELGLINMAVPESALPELKLRIRQFQSEIVGWLQNLENQERLVQIGTYMIPYKK